MPDYKHPMRGAGSSAGKADKTAQGPTPALQGVPTVPEQPFPMKNAKSGNTSFPPVKKQGNPY